MKVEKHLNLLGFKVQDKVTGLEGVIASVSFDLYGCVQALVRPPVNKDGALPECYWHDVDRLTIKSKKPVMKPPEFDYSKGPARKPTF